MIRQYHGYNFYFKIGNELLTFPITPSKLATKIGSNNKTVTLINEGDINILKSPSLVEIEFTARFPMRQYPYAREFVEFKTYHDKFKELKEQKKSFRFIVARSTPDGTETWGTDFLVSLESYTINENADDGDDVLIDFRLKQYKEYGVRVIPQKSTDSDKSNNSTKTDENKTTTSTSSENRPKDEQTDGSTAYTVKNGDTLWSIAKRFYGNGSKWTLIYNKNKNAIEEDAKKHGMKSSSNGHWIWAGLKLTIPSDK